MRIDKRKALRVLEEEVQLALSGPVPDEWLQRLDGLASVCGATNLTFFAVLGTAMLAKATDLDVDVFSLQEGESPRGYSARTLCKDVLAAHAPRLAIDLGVTGREPLNNQPFYAEKRISAGLPVRLNARRALAALIESLTALAAVSDEAEARLALRAFLHRRRRDESEWEIDAGSGAHLSLAGLVAAIHVFVTKDSELGKRAQAAAAGILDCAFGQDRVVTSRIHDPDRHFPGDVGVLGTGEDAHSIERTFEVRDKLVTAEDVRHFALRVLDRKIPNAGIVAVGSGQPAEDLEAGVQWAADRGLLVVAYSGWGTFVRDSLFWSPIPLRKSVREAYQRIFHRLNELEISNAGREMWERFGSIDAEESS